MVIPQLTIGKTVTKIPIIQGGMGVRVSLAKLASAVANEGGVGTISSIGLGDLEASKNDFERMSREALITEINKARDLTDGHLAVNIMGVLSNADDLVKTVAKEKVNTLIFGAGLPTKLPGLVEDSEINLVPIISSSRVAELILRSWKKYNRVVDAFILEGPLAGGHLGFSVEQLDNIKEHSVEKILAEVLEVIKPYEDQYGKKIPVIAAGGIFTGKDIARMLSLGASGVQMGTRFVCTHECDVSENFKQAYLDAKQEDIVIIKSPVGMPGRAIRNKFLEKVESVEKLSIRCNFRCLTACHVEKAKFCIAEALVKSYYGDVDNGLIFCGQNAYRVDKIISVKELIKELVDELKEV